MTCIQLNNCLPGITGLLENRVDTTLLLIAGKVPNSGKSVTPINYTPTGEAAYKEMRKRTQTKGNQI